MSKIGFLGAGAMATAIAGGISRNGRFQKFALTDPRSRAIELCRAVIVKGDVEVVSASELFATCDVVALCVKPQVAVTLLPTLQQYCNRPLCVISIIAGLTISTIHAALGDNARLIRAMPNTPLLVGQGATGFAAGPTATPADIELTRAIFGSIGYCAEVPEHLLDAVTGLSASGPAYIATVIEGLADGGVKQGLSRDLALRLAAQTVAGTGQLVLHGANGDFLHPALVKEMVCSPGGTSIHGLAAAERVGVRIAMMDAVEHATLRAKALGQSKL
jgi:pyrroline-5-carboxylate reductase